MKSAAQICAQVGAALEPHGLQKEVNLASSFVWRQARAPQTVPTGVAAVDALTGGLPRASLTEISGLPSSGRTALELALLASLTANGESCALIDADDAFDPASAEATGVDLDRLLWVRCGSLEQALSATDLVLGAGGFGAVVLDLAGIPAKRARRIPLSYWFRFRRAVEGTPTILALIDEEPCAQSAASLALHLEAEGAHWSAAASAPRNPGTPRLPGLPGPPPPGIPPHGRLLQGIRRCAQVIRNRNARPETSNTPEKTPELLMHVGRLQMDAAPSERKKAFALGVARGSHALFNRQSSIGNRQ
jgi:hypothetical protein